MINMPDIQHVIVTDNHHVGGKAKHTTQHHLIKQQNACRTSCLGFIYPVVP